MLLALIGDSGNTLQLCLELASLLLAACQMVALLINQGMKQLVEPFGHTPNRAIYLSSSVLHQAALLTPCRVQACYKIAHKLFKHLAGLLAGGADESLDCRCHYVVQSISECRLHCLVHTVKAFLQSVADALVQLLQCLLTLAAMVGDMH
ncbi:hypothetical protein D3C84_869040 [compost metagenome]